MDTIEYGYSSDQVSFKNGIAFLYGMIESVSDADIASALRYATDFATRDEEDEDFLNAYNNLSTSARLLYEVLHLLMTIGE